MSFLNPVNEPVLRFSSKDVGATQINYATRTAGDIKAVMKACLDTGYGAKAGAGWTTVNETATVIEFVSPSAAMSDYRLGIDDTSTSSTTWYYQYQDVRINPAYNAPTKSFSYVDKTHTSNGWQLLVTARGIIFVELVQNSLVNKLTARITHWGAVKSAIASVTGRNICFFNIGHNAAIANPHYFYNGSSYVHIQLETHTSAHMSAATSNALLAQAYTLDAANVDLVSPIYLASNDKALLMGELPPLLSKVVNSTTDVHGVSEFALDNRNVLSVCAGADYSNAVSANANARTFLIRTDYWEY